MRSLLLLGVAGVALSSAGAARAEGLTYNWIGTGDGTGPDSAWNQAGNWASDPGGAAGIPSYEAADTVSITQGAVNVGRKGLGAAYVDVSGGNLHLFAGKNLQATEKLTVRGAGVVTLDGEFNAGALLLQDGGTIDIMAPTDGKSGTLNVANETEMTGGTLNVGGAFAGWLMSMSGGTIQGPGQTSLVGLTQTGGAIDDVNLDITYYNYFGGGFSGDATVHGTFILSDNYGETEGTVAVEAGTTITGVAVDDPVYFGQDGRTRMSGAVSDFATYDQTGGLMDGTVSAGEYLLGVTGEVAGTVNFGTYFQLRDEATVTADAVLTGAEGSSMEQFGGTMNGSVGGIESYVQSGGAMAGSVETGLYAATGGTVSGSVEFSQGFVLLGDAEVTTTTKVFQTGGMMGSVLDGIDIYKQSGGSIDGRVTTRTFELAGGTAQGFDNVTITYELVQSGGTLAVDDLVVPVFSQSGGAFTGTVRVGTYNLNGGGASVDGSIIASDAFNLGPQSGTATLDARLSGTGALVKTVGSRVILTNGDSDFSGAVTVSAGALEVVDDALPDAAKVDIAGGATLQFTTNEGHDTSFAGTMTGETGALVKAGMGRLTLSGDIALGALAVNAGELHIGDGTSTETASFDSAVIEKDASLYIASGATLEIRIPNNITNYGSLINDGTVIDDLDNIGTFANNAAYIADVASNTGTINNNQPGYWTGDIESNAGSIINHQGATWDGAVEGNVANITNDGTWLNGTVTNGKAGVDPGLNFTKVIYNNYTGVWNGDIAENYSWVFNEGGTWNGDILSNHRQIWNDNRYGEIGIGYWVGDVIGNDGTVFNGGGGDWTGDVLGNGTAGYIKNDAPAVWHGGVYANDGTIENRGIWGGDVAGNGHYVINAKAWNGAVIAAGTLTSADTGNVPNIGNDGTIYNAGADAIWTGDVRGNIGRVDNRGGLWTGDVLTNVGTISNAAGLMNQVLTGNSSWEGDVLDNSGTIINATGSHWTGNVLANAGTIATTGLWTGDITSGGRLEAGGSITGAVVNSGTLALTGDLAVGSVSFGGNAFFDVDLDAAGEGEQLTATGAAALDGIVRIKAGAAMTTGDYQTPYVILSAASRTGTFDGVTTDLAFLTPILDYTATTASVTLQRNAQEFDAIGVTGNQQAVAGQVEALGAGNALYDTILWLTPEQAQAAFDQLSGEIYATAEAASATNVTLLGDIALDRVDKGRGGVDARGSASGYAATSGDPEGSSGAGLWTKFYGAYGSADGNGETSSTDGWIGGVALGLDGLVGDWRVGLMLDAGTGATNVAALGSSVDSTSYGVGLYGGANWGDTHLALAGLYTRHDNASTRNVEFQGFAEEISANYSSTTLQANAKLSHEFDFGAMSFTPYAGAAYINQATDGFSESGGDAALSHDGSSAATAVTTLGATVGYQMLVGDGMLVTASVSLDWRHSFAGGADASLSLAGGGLIVVAGTAPQSDTATLAAGLNLDLNDQTALDLAYDAQVGSSSQTHAFSGTWTTKF